MRRDTEGLWGHHIGTVTHGLKETGFLDAAWMLTAHLREETRFLWR